MLLYTICLEIEENFYVADEVYKLAVGMMMMMMTMMMMMMIWFVGEYFSLRC